jgi:hypothetical protein
VGAFWSGYLDSLVLVLDEYMGNAQFRGRFGGAFTARKILYLV